MRFVADRVVAVRMVDDVRVAAVVVALGGVHRLRSAHLLGRLAEQSELAGEAEPLHRRLRREDADECSGAER